MLLFAVCFFGKGRVGLVDGFRYVAYMYMVCDLPIVDFRSDDDVVVDDYM